jgi:ribosomal protein S18 acetylase RimI-like enzyme
VVDPVLEVVLLFGERAGGGPATLRRMSGTRDHRAILGDVEIRELVAGGADQLMGLFAAVLPDSPTAMADGVDGAEAFLDDQSSFVLGAYVDDAPVGLAWGLQMRSPSGRLTTYVHELEVREESRRKGVGSALITQAMALARRRGSTKLWLSTGGHNHGAQALYGSLGGERKPLGDVNYWWDL